MTAPGNLPFWSFYRLLEADLEATFQFVAPVENQLDVYSDQFARIILLACVELENAMVALAAAIDPDEAPSNLFEHYHVVYSKYESFTEMVISAPRFGLRLRPWEEWTHDSNPDWWRLGYNKIKHDRLGNPGAATLRRALASVAALLVVLLHLYREKDGIHGIPEEEKPKLFLPVRDHEQFFSHFEFWTWPLPDDTRALRELNRRLEVTKRMLDGNPDSG